MHAVRLHAFGPAENLTYERTADPEPGPGQVRVAVTAAGVHLIDTALRKGTTKGPYGPPELPTVPGREVAGTVDALGEGTDPSWLGRRVVAHLGMVPGGYAELAVTDAGNLHEIPEGLREDHAIAMVGTGRMALDILSFREPAADDVVVVLAAAGGVGALLVQLAKGAGARVLGLAGGPAKVERVRGLGADVALDYTRPDWADAARSALGDAGATVVFDGVGGPAARAAVGLLGTGGTHVAYGWASAVTTGETPDPVLTPAELAARSLTSHDVLGDPMMKRVGGPEGMRRLRAEALRRAAAGSFTPLITRFPLAEAAEAHRALESRGTVGKVVLIP
ncbi:zinc-binding dehydrogenase [Streptomyces albireticuli]|uniref:Oxidoreductase n=1 Tax=Streptomyces albireticuli TaxID=1940 RepID=A0A2A2DA66_9ACTN|nr:zinc-binding dehydrogenase [Streptomyces albireticuli]MCD9143018.1 zinc-binding dehydrogenase [Streptomyces albireticuli]MCD9165261.1 zinc-binding dehydrogenase [Streptomyces albireticuli]MCD9192221.1 zinc-binding dehydrogenase [Streptomyces albireticuli]PAU48326.1 oxidoreductase [Streptomyces albireticuli]